MLYLRRRIASLERKRRRRKSAGKRQDTATRSSGSEHFSSTGEHFKDNQIVEAVPVNFSIHDNPDEVITFFNRVISLIKSGKHNIQRMVFDFRKVTHISIDAIMYLIAIIHNIRTRLYAITEFQGNVPVDEKARELLLNSGFMRYVKSPNSPPESTEAHILIESDSKINLNTFKKVCDFVHEKSGTTKKDTAFLYQLISELANNVFDHAYIQDSHDIFKRNWYSYVEQLENGFFRFVFLDTGAGIWKTIRKNNWAEKLTLTSSQADVIISALNGAFRTSTAMYNRGNGLPSIKQHATSGKIDNLTIITNNAYCYMSSIDGMEIKKKDMRSSLSGTVYYWEIDATVIKEKVS